MLLYITLLMAFLSSYLICKILFGIMFRTRRIINMRLDRIARDEQKEKEHELNQSLFTRVIRPMMDDVSKFVIKITPKEIVNILEKKVAMAGEPMGLTVKDWISVQGAVILCLPVVTISIGYSFNAGAKNILLIVFAEVGLGLILPNFVLSKNIGDRQKKIENSLPDVLDLLTVSVEAGLGFDGALAKVIDKMPGPLAIEFENVLQEMKVGKQKRDALKDMAGRVGVQDLTTFIGSVIQADQLGVSIGNVLRIQSQQMREKRRQRAREKAMKAPVKMLIPMVLFIFPTIFTVLIGPVVIRIMNAFAK